MSRRRVFRRVAFVMSIGVLGAATLRAPLQRSNGTRVDVPILR